MQDNHILTSIEVGVAYDTDVHYATEIMLQAVTKLDFIFRDPKPFVLFSDFGNSSLNFQVYFAI